MFVWLGDGANEVEKSEGVTVAMVRLKKLPSQLQYHPNCPSYKLESKGKKNTREVDHATMVFYCPLPKRSLWRSLV